MKCEREMMRLYAVTDRSWTQKMSLYDQVEAALQNGVTCVQLREKALDAASFLEEARSICALCHQYNVPFIVNDDVELALQCGADGVHVGQDDMAAAEVRRRAGDRLIVGVSAHNIEEAVDAMRAGADYLGVGAVFGSATKTNVCKMNNDILRGICAAVDIPVVAIGGINAENMTQLKGCGADGVAVVSAIFAAEDPGKAAAHLRALSDELFG